jgi:hypothetical protein
MARVEHLCVDGKWREGPTSECGKHKRVLPRRRVEGADTK